MFVTEEAESLDLEKPKLDPIGPALRLAAGAACFLTGGRRRLNMAHVRDLSGDVVPAPGELTLALRRYRLPGQRPVCLAALPQSGLRSLMSVSRVDTHAARP